MQEKISQYTSEINSFQPKSNDELESFRIRFLGTKGIIKDLFETFKTVSPEEKRVLGKVLNEFKQILGLTLLFREKDSNSVHAIPYLW
jgi:phenylalanyl-tRNA synthetase alpha chain